MWEQHDTSSRNTAHFAQRLPGRADLRRVAGTRIFARRGDFRKRVFAQVPATIAMVHQQMPAGETIQVNLVTTSEVEPQSIDFALNDSATAREARPHRRE